MNELKKHGCISILSVINAVTLMLLLSCLNDNSVMAKATERKPPTKAERNVEQQIEAGKDVDVHGEEISAEFLGDLLKKYSSQDSKPSESVSIRNAMISHKLELHQTTIPYWLSLEDCIFNDDVNLSDSVFQKNLSLRGSTFKGAVNFYQVSVDGNLRIDKAKFPNKQKQINFDSIKVAGTFYFYEVEVLEGSFTLSDSVMNKLECTDTKFNNNEAQFTDIDDKVKPLEDNANFYHIKVNGNADFARASFAGLANFENIDIGGNLELTNGLFNSPSKTIKFFGMKVGRNAIFNEVKFAGGFDMSKAEVGSTLEFNKTQATNTNLAKNFSGMKVDTAIFDQAELSLPYNLQDVDYRHLNPDSDYQKTLQLIEKPEYSPSSFTNLEAYYRRSGMEKAADEVYIAGKIKEGNSATGFAYFTNWLLDITVRYGKWPWLALVWSAAFISIGWLAVFRKQNMMPQEQKDKKEPQKKEEQKDKDPMAGYSPLWYSIALFLPIVDLEDAKKWTLRPEKKLERHYLRVHIILGYLFIPIGLAAWTGLIK